MIAIDRRAFVAGLAALAAPGGARAQVSPVVDSTGREIPVHERVRRVFPAGPPAAIVLYVVAPDLLLGWPRAMTPAEKSFLLPEIAARPEVGRLTGRGNTANLEVVVQLAPDLILDVGSTDATYVSLAERVQRQTGIPYALVDGRLDATAETLLTVGRLVRREERAIALAKYTETLLRTMMERVGRVPEDRRPRVYYARGPGGLETALGGSITIEAIALMGGRNVAGQQTGGLATVSLEQVLAWDPEVIVTVDPAFALSVRTDPNWAPVRAVRDGRVHLAPSLPFGWVDFPPGVNRLVGLWWLGRVLYPELFPEDIRPIARDFYTRFYHVEPSEAQLDRLLAGTG